MKLVGGRELHSSGL